MSPEEALKFKNVKDKHPGMKLVRLRDNHEMELEHIVGNEYYWMASRQTKVGKVYSNIFPDDEVIVIE